MSLTKSFVLKPPCTLVPLLMHPSRLACQKNVPCVMADWFDAIPVYPSYGSHLHIPRVSQRRSLGVSLRGREFHLKAIVENLRV